MIRDHKNRMYEIVEVDMQTTLIRDIQSKDYVRIMNYEIDTIGFETVREGNY